MSEWQDIETAPTEEYAEFIVAENILDTLWNMDFAKRIDGQIVRAWDHQPYKKRQAEWTHWAPLPPPPSDIKGE